MGRIKSGSLVQKTFLYPCKRKQKEEAELGQEYFEGSITPVTWAAHLGGAEAAVTTGEQRRNLPCAFFCTGCLGTCSFHTALLGWVFCLLLRQNLVHLLWTISTTPRVFLTCVLLILFQLSHGWGERNENTKGKWIAEQIQISKSTDTWHETDAEWLSSDAYGVM